MENLKDLLDQYFSIKDKVHEAFAYKEDWVTIALEDSRECYWKLLGEGPGEVHFGLTPEEVEEPMYCYEIYTQRFLPRWVYRTPDYTMIAVDTQCDGNKFLSIFDNKKEIK